MSNQSALEIARVQQALAHKGFDPGQIDGIWGRRTELAVRRFQLARGLTVDGIVGPNTRLALFGSIQPVQPANDPGLPWLQEARRLIGLKESPGPADNPTILDWANDLDIKYGDDEVAWCGLYVAHCIGSTLSSEPLPTNPLGARNWARWGAPCEPQPGRCWCFGEGIGMAGRAMSASTSGRSRSRATRQCTTCSGATSLTRCAWRAWPRTGSSRHAGLRRRRCQPVRACALQKKAASFRTRTRRLEAQSAGVTGRKV